MTFSEIVTAVLVANGITVLAFYAFGLAKRKETELKGAVALVVVGVTVALFALASAQSQAKRLQTGFVRAASE